MLPLLLLLADPAYAHRPHAVVVALATSPDFETSGRAWIVYDPSDNAQLLCTNDWGAHWDHAGGPPQADAVRGMGYFGTTLVVLAADGTVWATEDEGASWGSFELAAGDPIALATTSTRIAIGTDDGVWAGDSLVPSTWQTALAGESIAEVAWAATGEAVLLARHEDGRLYRSVDGGITFLTVTSVPDPSGATAAAEAAGVTWAGTSEGVYRLESTGWAACGALPTSGETWRADYVTQLVAQPSGGVFATTATDAFFWSEDGCDTWTAVESGLTATFGGIGGVADMDQTFVGAILAGDHGIVAGFDGLVTSADAGASWRNVKFVATDYVRGLFVSPSFPVDPRVMFGTYGGGAVWTADGGRTFQGSNVGLRGPYNFSLAASPDFATSDLALWAGGEPDAPALSHDGGATWEVLDMGFDQATGTGVAGGRLYLFGSSDAEVGGRVARSADGGETWEWMDALHTVLAGVYPSFVRESVLGGSTRLLVATDRPAMVLASDDDGSTWTTLTTWEETERTAGLQVWRGSRILHATYTSGLHASDDGGATWIELDGPVDHPRTLAQADDGTLFTADGGGQIYRSFDGGNSWAAVGDPIRPTVSLIAPAANFALEGVAFLGTSQGVYWTDDHGDSWHAFPRFQRFATQGFHLTCESGCTSYDDGSEGLADAWDLDELAVVTFSFDGTSLRMVAEEVFGTPGWVVEVDGAPVPTDTTAEWLVSDLTPGWHDVTLRVAGGTMRLSAVEAVGEGEVFPFDAGEDTGGDTGGDTAVDTGGDTAPVDIPEDTAVDTADSAPERDVAPPADEPCGCHGGSAAIALPLVLLGATRRRRR